MAKTISWYDLAVPESAQPETSPESRNVGVAIRRHACKEPPVKTLGLSGVSVGVVSFHTVRSMCLTASVLAPVGDITPTAL